VGERALKRTARRDRGKKVKRIRREKRRLRGLAKKLESTAPVSDACSRTTAWRFGGKRSRGKKGGEHRTEEERLIKAFRLEDVVVHNRLLIFYSPALS